MNPDIRKQVRDVLTGAGYEGLPNSFGIGTVTFESLSAFIGGPGSLDLVLVLDVGQATAAGQAELRWTVERVARALDAAGSRRPLSTVLLTERAIPTELVDNILRVARVVSVSSALDVPLQLAPLLPLDSLASGLIETDALERLAPYLQGNRDANQFRRFISDSRDGAPKVEDRLSTWLDASFTKREEVQ